MKTWPTLYKRARTGQILQWIIQVAEEAFPIIDKWSGQLGSDNLIHHSEQISAGVNLGKSNETTPTQQALLQAESDWKKKKDSGYKSLEELGISEQCLQIPPTLFHTDGKPVTLQDMLEQHLPQFNSDAQGNILPMLAPSKLWAPSPKNKYPAQWEIKFDGNRTTLVMDLEETYALTRTGKPHTQLQHLCDELDRVFPIAERTEKVILDGEVYLHGLELELLRTALTKGNEWTSKLQFMVYDLPLHPESQMYRTATTHNLVYNMGSHFFQFSSFIIVHSDEEVQALTDKAEEDGYEGGMVKDLNGSYSQGQRSPVWRKVKRREDHEYLTVGYVLGQRGVQDLKFICVVKVADVPCKFEVTMNGSVEVKQKMFEQIDSYIGKQLTVSHKGYTAYGIPNHAKGKAFREEGT